MEQSGHLNGSQLVVDISGLINASTSTSPHDRYFSNIGTSGHGEGPTSVGFTVSQQSVPVSSVLNESNPRNSSLTRLEGTRQLRNPLNSGFWISIELFLTVSQIFASIIVLSLSRHEHPSIPLFAWIIGYASGYVALLPLLYWRYHHGNQIQEQDSSHLGETSQMNVSSRTYHSVARTNGLEDDQAAASSHRSNQDSWLMNARLKRLMECFKTAIDCYFAVWFVVGIAWIFGAQSSAVAAPNLYRLTIVFLIYSCIGYAMPFLACCICLTMYEDNDELRELACSHLFHKDCVDKWLKINALCPLCKSEVGEVENARGSSDSVENASRRVENI